MNALGRGLAYISSSVCRSIVDVQRLADSVEQAFRWQAQGRIVLPEAGVLRLKSSEAGYTSHVKAVLLLDAGVAGVRMVGYRVNPDGSRPNADRATRAILLSDMSTGEPLAFVDERYNYSLRTAASVAVAARHLAPARPSLGLIGVGHVGEAALRVFDALFPLERIRVTSRRPESRQGFVAKHCDHVSAPMEVVDTADEVIATSNLIVMATTGDQPLLRRDHLRPGLLICTLGSFEVDPAVYGAVDKVFVDDWSQTCTKKDMKPVIEGEFLSQETLTAELGEVVIGAKAGRETADETIVVRTEGLVSQDVALAYWSYRQAIALDRLQWIVPPDGEGSAAWGM